MPGLVGYVSHDPVDERLIEVLVQPMRHRPNYKIRRQVEKTFAVASIDLVAGRQSDMAESTDGRNFQSVFSKKRASF